MNPNITVENVSLFCRICLCELRGQKHYIQELKGFSQIILICTSLLLDNDTGYSKFICHGCYGKLRQFHEYRAKAKASRIFVGKIIDADTIAKTEKNLKDLKFIDIQKMSSESESDLKVLMASGVLNNPTSKSDIRQQTPIIIEKKTTVSTQISENDSDYNTYIINDEEIGTHLQIEIHKTPLNTKSIENYSSSETMKPVGTKENNWKINLSRNPQSSCNATQTECIGMTTNSVTSKTNTSDPEKVVRLNTLSANKNVSVFHCQDCNNYNDQREIRTSVPLMPHNNSKPFRCCNCNRWCNFRSDTRSCNVCSSNTYFMSKKHESPSKICCLDAKKSYSVDQIKQNEKKAKELLCKDCKESLRNLLQNELCSSDHKITNECEQCKMLNVGEKKKFECPYCGMKKATRNELRSHINYHTKTKSWPCPHCSCVFKTAENLSTHDRNMHNGALHLNTRYRDQSFKKPNNLKYHETESDFNSSERRYINLATSRDNFQIRNISGKPRKRTRLSLGNSPRISDKEYLTYGTLKNPYV